MTGYRLFDYWIKKKFALSLGFHFNINYLPHNDIIIIGWVYEFGDKIWLGFFIPPGNEIFYCSNRKSFSHTTMISIGYLSDPEIFNKVDALLRDYGFLCK